MKSLQKKGDDLNPEIQFDPESGSLLIKGKSIPLEIDQFFEEVIDWLERYSQNPSEHTRLEIDLKYLNGKSLRTILGILYKLKTIRDNGKDVRIEWLVPRDAEDLRDISERVLTELSLPHDIRVN